MLGLLYVWNVWWHFWTLPAPSDPLQYLGPAAWGTTYGYWPWLDRLTLAVSLRIAVLLLPVEPYVAGPGYVLGVNVLLLLLGVVWAYRRSGAWAATFVAAFFNSSFLLLGWSTYMYPDQTVALWAILAFMLFYSRHPATRFFRPLLLAGFCTGLACFSKATGISTLALLVPLALDRRGWRQAGEFVLGVGVGCTLVLAAFCLLYNWQSLANVVDLFFRQSLRANLSSAAGDNYVSYVSTLLNLHYFPFLALLMAAGAYRVSPSREVFLFGWVFVVLMCLLSAFSGRGGSPIPHYVYTGYVCTVLGLSVYLGSGLEEEGRSWASRGREFWLVGAGLFAVLIVGLRVGLAYPPVVAFDYSYAYHRVTDIYVRHGLGYPLWARWLYVLGPLCTLCLLAWAACTRQRGAVVGFMLTMALWTSAHNGGLAAKKAVADRSEASFFYRAASALEATPGDRFAVFVREWNLNPRVERVLWVYRLFYDRKYHKGHEYDAKYEHELAVTRSIKIITDEKELPNVRGGYILTDDVEAAEGAFAECVVVGRVPWGRSHLAYVRVTPPVPVFRLEAGSGLQGRKYSNDELASLSLAMTGHRGEFQYEVADDRGSCISITPVRRDSGGELAIQLAFGPGVVLQRDQAVTVMAYVRVNGEPKKCHLFVQDHVEEWRRVQTEEISTSEWREFRLLKTIRKGADQAATGIYWEPLALDDTLVIRGVQVCQ
ncbi:ArnT family glycosyltransferase [Candidatus Latescibacterota bacterium]